MRFDGLIFDVDGTVWDSTNVVKDAWNKALLDFGIEGVNITADTLKGLFGLPMDDIIEKILPNEPLEKRMAFKPLCFQYEHSFLEEKAGDVYPEFEKMLAELERRGHHLSVVSNCQAGYIELMYRKTGFGRYFKDQLCPGDSGLLKAGNIKLIASRNNLKNPIYVGDTQMDANACREAGVPIIYCRYGFGSVENADYIVDSPMDILNLDL